MIRGSVSSCLDLSDIKISPENEIDESGIWNTLVSCKEEEAAS